MRALALEPVPRQKRGAKAKIGTQPNAAYVEHLMAALDGRRLDGLRVVLDCANGAASEVGPAVFRALGAEVDVLHANPTAPTSTRLRFDASGRPAGEGRRRGSRRRSRVRR